MAEAESLRPEPLSVSLITQEKFPCLLKAPAYCQVVLDGLGCMVTGLGVVVVDCLCQGCKVGGGDLDQGHGVEGRPWARIGYWDRHPYRRGYGGPGVESG